ncbi:hypothetical protein SAMN02800692_1894 [Luteibacter sp. UNC138MFCol5.1]|uniref:pilus assembly FimT family protein n=1 Tax=Luteibacter sp. UNC138MFCol5.1 TaxID=1502774 RepID=UPI0008B750D2|nr:type II secretion system protein [Luteibacter sp. UNC138MFCol5.1]SEO74895.1 hypothetical protein SAMN02800692_1894 [Luteibacter sp. UNC138MFCol5.1]
MTRAARGSTLIELLVGLAVATLVAAIAMTSLSLAGVAAARRLATARADDAAWLALAAIARDLRSSDTWHGCVGSIACAGHEGHEGPAALVLAVDGRQVAWFTERGLMRCELTCETYLDGIARVAFRADVPGPNGSIRRVPLAEGHGDDALAIGVALWTTDGRRFERTVWRPHAR